MTLYLDLNIFDRLEKLDRLSPSEKVLYQPLFELLTAKQIVTAYSNAHLNDLFRGYQKNPTYIDNHLHNIQQYTENLCICQYWGRKEITWHYRNVFDFFEEKKNEGTVAPKSYETLFEDFPPMQTYLELFKNIPLPDDFKKGYSDTIFGIMFPLSKIHPNMYSLQVDIFNFHTYLKSDYAFYKSFKRHLITNLNKMKNNKELIKYLNLCWENLPHHLEVTDILDLYTPANKYSENLMYEKIIEVFFKFDLAGYKSDGHFNNMLDDALHTFYAAHFDFFITNDDRCKYKAEKTYSKLNIGTKVLKIEELHLLR